MADANHLLPITGFFVGIISHPIDQGSLYTDWNGNPRFVLSQPGVVSLTVIVRLYPNVLQLMQGLSLNPVPVDAATQRRL